MAERKRTKGNKKRVFAKNRRLPKWKQQVKQIEDVVSRYESMNGEEIERFSDIPLSPPTLEGLMKSGFANPTDIQKAAIPLALRGKDVLGAAKTGSGKTLAFLIPVLELLWRERWSQVDGLGALIISPTRELAYQTFEVLRKIGGSHDFSAGLVIGGHELASEQKQIQRTNIVVCTPGRLLQHMDETPDFQCLGLKLLVLDETDRIMDLGFRQAMNSIVENLPTDRQTLLFSATQTKSVKDLAMLSLDDPEYVSVHEESQTSTPYKLSQSYIVCNLQDKLSTLFSFIKSHLSSKTIVFMSSCKQVKFVYEAFRRFRPGVPLMALYGRQKQLKRVGIYNDYCRKKSAVLLCTDIAARGLDFPSVDWVVQLDCPEDANTYIHRVGRTARYEKNGQALLFLLPSEETGMLAELQTKKIPIEEIKVNPKKMMSVQSKLNSFCAQDVEMKHWAQRSFICYLRSIHLKSNKKVFDVKKLPTEEYAMSLGLPQAPRIRFLKKGAKGKVESGTTLESSDESEPGSSSEEDIDDKQDDDDDDQVLKKVVDKKSPRLLNLSSKRLKKLANDDLLTVKSVLLYGKEEQESDDGHEPARTGNESAKTENEPPSAIMKKSQKTMSKYATAKKLVNKGIKVNKHITFDDNTTDSNDDHDTPPLPEEEGSRDVVMENDDATTTVQPIPMEEYENNRWSTAGEAAIGGINIKKAKMMMKATDKQDRHRERMRIKQEHSKQRKKEREKRKMDSYGGGGGGGDEGGTPIVTLGQDESGSEDERAGPDAKRRKHSPKDFESADESNSESQEYLENDEELALHLLKT